MIRFEQISNKLIPDLTIIMTAAFDDDTKRYLGKDSGGPPGYDDGTFLKEFGLESDSHSFAIYWEDELVGAYIVFWNEEGESRLGNIFIDPEKQGLGIGFKVWEHIEKTYPSKSWILDTPTWSVRNHHFYEKCGFKRVKVQGDDVVFTRKL